jgi:hypothetical protein
LPSLPLLKIPGAILAHAKSLLGGGDGTKASPLTEDAPFAPRVVVTNHSPDVANAWDPTKPDNTFWATMAGADRRLAELRRAIDEAAAETMAREAAVAAPSHANPHPGESRCETAARVISDALDEEKS